jgi:hypothetical protein
VARPSIKAITDAVLARLGNLTPVTVMSGEVSTSPPIVAQTDRIAPYVVLYAFGPTDVPEGDLGDAPADLVYTFQVDCVAAYQADAQWLVDQVVAQLDRWAPSVTGMVVGRFKPPVGYDPGPFRRDDAVNPSRFSLPLQYRTTATLTT